MIVVKYFHEEPAAVEILASDVHPEARGSAEPQSLEAFLSGPRYYRGYLAASDVESGTTGATSVRRTDVWLEPLLAALPADAWWRLVDGWSLTDGEAALVDAVKGTVLAVSPNEPPGASFEDADVRHALPSIRTMMDAGIVVLVAEPAPDGVDWAIFSPAPTADRLREAFAASPSVGARRFVIPFREARGEHRFYFERYDLDLYARYEV